MPQGLLPFDTSELQIVSLGAAAAALESLSGVLLWMRTTCIRPFSNMGESVFTSGEGCITDGDVSCLAVSSGAAEPASL